MSSNTAPDSLEKQVLSIAEIRKGERPYFNNRRLLDFTPPEEYVCWIDIMGSAKIMLRSLNVASICLMKLHVAAIDARELYPVELYPMIDGIYVCSPSKITILRFINKVISSLAINFILEKKPYHKFEIRSGLAFGPIIKGKETLECADQLKKNEDHAKRVLIGPPLTHAFEMEKQSPPFGVALHESAPVTAGKYWKWWKAYCPRDNNLLAPLLFESLKTHYEWCKIHSEELSYEGNAIDRHQSLAESYFSK